MCLYASKLKHGVKVSSKLLAASSNFQVRLRKMSESFTFHAVHKTAFIDMKSFVGKLGNHPSQYMPFKNRKLGGGKKARS